MRHFERKQLCAWNADGIIFICKQNMNKYPGSVRKPYHKGAGND